jgi:hypothetical protein
MIAPAFTKLGFHQSAYLPISLPPLRFISPVVKPISACNIHTRLPENLVPVLDKLRFGSNKFIVSVMCLNIILIKIN